MKKNLFILGAILVMTLSGCTKNYAARKLGGTVEIKVEPGYKVTSATWKETDLFYFLEPMEPSYEPKEKLFVESSSLGILESKVVFKESRK